MVEQTTIRLEVLVLAVKVLLVAMVVFTQTTTLLKALVAVDLVI